MPSAILNKHFMFLCPYSYRSSNDLPPNRSPSVYPLLSYSTSSSLSRVSYPRSSYILSTSPPLILLWPESQDRWSMQADAPHPVSQKRKNKGWIQSKQNLLEGAQKTSREVHGSINPGFDQGTALHRQVERTHAGCHKSNDKDVFLGSILMLRSTINFTAVGMPLSPSDVPSDCLLGQTVQFESIHRVK